MREIDSSMRAFPHTVEFTLPTGARRTYHSNMSRVLTIIGLCIAIVACPFICRASGCCGTPSESAVQNERCCCDRSGESNQNTNDPVDSPAPCKKQCLCNGALVSKSVVQIQPPELSLLELVAPVAEFVEGIVPTHVENLRPAAVNEFCCLNVRLLI